MGPQTPNSPAHLAATTTFIAIPLTLLAAGAFYVFASFRQSDPTP
jgi:hypothetical protein